MDQKKELMREEYSEEWGVIVGKKEYILNEKQIIVLQEATLSGNRGIVWFDEFAISLAHIESIYLIRTYKKSDRAFKEYEEVTDKYGRISYRVKQ